MIKYLPLVAVGSSFTWGVIRRLKRGEMNKFAKSPVLTSLECVADGILYGTGVGLAVSLVPVTAPVVILATNIASGAHIYRNFIQKDDKDTSNEGDAEQQSNDNDDKSDEKDNA